MKKQRVCYIISHINKSLGFEWTAALLQQQVDLHFILLGEKDTALASFLAKQKLPVLVIPYAGKKDIPRAFWQIWRYLLKTKPHSIHAHLLEAGVIGLAAAFFAGIPKRIYTRHHSNYHHVYAPQGIKYDRWCNALATHIVAISQNVANILEHTEKVPPAKIHLIHHGFALSYFEKPDSNVIQQLKQQYNPANCYPVIGVISRQTFFKGIQHVIAAFAQLLPKYPNALLLLANATGEYKPTITQLLHTHIPPQNWREIVFEPHLAELYQLFTVYVHVPVTAQCEAFGQTYVEALAAQIPSVFTLSGVAAEFIEHEQNALVVPFNEVNSISESIERILTNPQLTKKITENGIESVHQQFTLQTMIDKLINLYNHT